MATYVSSNPGATGTVSDAAAGIPGWFNKYPGMSNVVSGGRTFVFITGVTDAEGFAIAKKCGGGLKCGVTKAGQVLLPGESMPAITTLPGGVPANGAVVIAL